MTVPVPLAVLLAGIATACQQASFSNVSEQLPARTTSGEHGDEAGARSGPAGKAVFPAPEHDFGHVAQGEEVQHVFKIRNTGEGVLHIKRVRGS